MNYFTNNLNQNKIEQNDKDKNGKLIVAFRIPKTGIPPQPNTNIIDAMYHTSSCMPYNVCPKMFYDAYNYISYPGVMPYTYIITTRGCIYDPNGELHKDYNDDGYMGIGLRMVNGLVKKLKVHRLVAYQFCNPPHDFQLMAVNHINGDKHCNFANNLEWITIAQNNQHGFILHSKRDTRIINGRPLVDENFVRFLCEQFMDGKSNTDIMRDLGMEINNANHTLLRDIREGYTWKNITYQYDFPKSSKKHAYTEQEKDQIKQYMMQNMTNKEIFKLMQGREYVASTDRRDSSYRTIQSIRASSWYSTYLYKLSHNML
jgi:DNA-binding CsgD family transcriptional regulator